MSRQRFQRPEVFKSGKRVKVWRVEYRVYIRQPDGREKQRHTSETIGRLASMTKAEAQRRADKIVAAATGSVRADGSTKLQEFFETVYLPIQLPKWAKNTRSANASCLKNHVYPRFGKWPLEEIKKIDIERYLLSMAEAGKCQTIVSRVLILLKDAFEEAVENDYIAKNPAARIEAPRCEPVRDNRALTLNEVRRIFATTDGRTRLMFRVLILCGCRIGEALALRWRDLQDGWFLISRSALDGQPGPTKGRKSRVAPVPASLMAELNHWRSLTVFSGEDDLIFAAQTGHMVWRQTAENTMLARAKQQSGIQDLTFHMCRRTFSTLFEGDVADVQGILGHVKLDTTLDHYRKGIPERQRLAVEALDARLRVSITPDSSTPCESKRDKA